MEMISMNRGRLNILKAICVLTIITQLLACTATSRQVIPTTDKTMTQIYAEKTNLRGVLIDPTTIIDDSSRVIVYVTPHFSAQEKLEVPGYTASFPLYG